MGSMSSSNIRTTTESEQVPGVPAATASGAGPEVEASPPHDQEIIPSLFCPLESDLDESGRAHTLPYNANGMAAEL
jgi:hypothetical protein